MEFCGSFLVTEERNRKTIYEFNVKNWMIYRRTVYNWNVFLRTVHKDAMVIKKDF